MKLNKHEEPIKWLLISSLASLCICYFFYGAFSAMSIADQRDIAKVVISLFGTFLGFLFTLLAIIISLSSHRLIKNMIATGHYANLILSSQILSILLFVTITICFFSLFFITAWFFTGLIALVILTAIFACRTIYKFFLILRHVN